jgi:hypothetical protein
MGLRRSYNNIGVTLKIHPSSYLSFKTKLETGFCFRLQVKPIQLGPTDRASLLSGDRE